MAIDWKQLIRVRERSRSVAVDEARREAAGVAEREADVARAEAVWRAEEASRRALWDGVAHTGPAGMRMDDLRGAAAWGRRLDQHVAEAGAKAGDTRAARAAQEARLAESRERVRRAAAECQRAVKMQERAQAALRRRQEGRLEDAAEEVAVRVWTAQRARG